ncbi:hypothetical protein C8Q78DRAFT_94745 [Trametes maxima]|nr:hypothetical protein C8Q78DRAFT_94745 [Trametes maxima]
MTVRDYTGTIHLPSYQGKRVPECAPWSPLPAGGTSTAPASRSYAFCRCSRHLSSSVTGPGRTNTALAVPEYPLVKRILGARSPGLTTGRPPLAAGGTVTVIFR